MQRINRSLVFAVALLLATPFLVPDAHAQADEKDEKLEDLVHDFELMRHESFLVPGMESLGFEEVEASENWLQRFAKKWPRDLVVAPVPGYSPQHWLESEAGRRLLQGSN